MAFFMGQLLKNKKTGESWIVTGDGLMVQLQRTIVLPEHDVAKQFTAIDMIAGPAFPKRKFARGLKGVGK